MRENREGNTWRKSAVVETADAAALKRMMDRGQEIVLVDARAEEDYALDHLPGAVSLLNADVERLAHEKIRKGVPVVVYSNDANCPASGLVAGKLEAMGYGPVYDYNESYRDWLSRGYPLQKGD